MMLIAPEYGSNEVSDHFRDLAMAYLDAAERLCKDLCSESWPPTFHKGQVTLWLAFHATELLIKGCIRKASPEQLKNKHSLGELLLTFSALYPALEFNPPFGPEPVPADWELMELALKSDATFHQRLRYPVDTAGSQWGGIRTYSPELFSAELETLRQDFKRISTAVFSA